jgi:DNA-binding NarL/FixJ family response regulator
MSLLTQRQQQVAEQVVRGASNKEIAYTLNLSPRTVEIHRYNIFHKLGVRNAVELTRKMLSGETETI